MMRRLGLEPAWVEDLLGIWAASDATGGARGLSGASPMFRLWGVVSDSHDDTDDGYSSAELAALRLELEWLQVQHEPMWLAIVATFKPWRAGPPADDETKRLAMRAARLLASRVDKRLA